MINSSDIYPKFLEWQFNSYCIAIWDFEWIQIEHPTNMHFPFRARNFEKQLGAGIPLFKFDFSRSGSVAESLPFVLDDFGFFNKFVEFFLLFFMPSECIVQFLSELARSHRIGSLTFRSSIITFVHFCLLVLWRICFCCEFCCQLQHSSE